MVSIASSSPPLEPSVRDDDADTHALAALDDPAEWPAFSRPVASREGWLESYLALEGMHCATCALTVEDALARLPGVENVVVNGATATARLQWHPASAKPSAWIAALRKSGYGAVPAADLLDAAPRARAQRVLLWRWLVAGFCMMQVMMYATPAYVAAPGEITPDITRLLGWASWVLTLPVVLFSCGPFFSGALRDVRARRIGMDVPVALGILIAFAASTVSTFDPQGPLGAHVWFDSVAMFAFFLLSGRLLELGLRDRTAGALESLMRRLPATVLRLADDGEWERVAVRRLAVGDHVRVLPGEGIPADGLLREGDTRVDEALLTGESRPVAKAPGSRLIAGSHNLTAAIEMTVRKTGADTRYGGIVALMEQASLEKPRLAQAADRIAGPFLAAVLLAAAGAALWWWPVDPARAIGVAVAVLIVTCPCALSLATPAATLAAAGALARRGVLVRRLQALEAAAGVDAVVFDKTGTLTDETLTLGDGGRVEPGMTESLSLQASPAIHASHTTDATALAMAGALAQYSLHPASRAIHLAALGAGASAPAVTADDVREEAGRGVTGCVRVQGGAPIRLRLGSARFCGAATVAQDVDAGTRVYLAGPDGPIASFELVEALRPDAAAGMRELMEQRVQVSLLSGDEPSRVARLARRVGIVFAQGACSPQDKLARLSEMQARGQRVAMVGDGLNDGPVLARADVSIAMGQGAPLAQAKSDFIVPGGQVAAVPRILRLAKRTRRVVRQNLGWAAAYNAVCVPLAAVGLMPPWLAGLGMAASSLLVVANAARLARD